jgi:hypothetical protein
MEIGRKKMAEPGDSKLHVFISYCRKDQRWLERLQTHLSPLGHDYDIVYWDDTKIRPGANWRDEIRSAIDMCDVAVLIISADLAWRSGEVDRKHTAAVAGEAAGTIRRLRRQIEGLKARLAGIQAGNKTVRCR